MYHRVFACATTMTLFLVGCGQGPTSPGGSRQTAGQTPDRDGPGHDMDSGELLEPSQPGIHVNLGMSDEPAFEEAAPPTPPDPGSEPQSQTPAPSTVVRPYHEWGIEETVADSLGRIGEPAVGSLVRMLRHPDPDRRIQAAAILARIGPQAKEAVPGLVSALEDPEVEVQKAAARALGQIGPAAADAVGPLLRVLEDASSVSAEPANTLR